MTAHGMTQSVIFTLGTPFGDWEHLASSLLARAEPLADLRSAALTLWLDRTIGPTPNAPSTGPGPGHVQPFDEPDGPVWGGMDVRACWVLDGLARQWPQARYLIFVDGPVHTLATWLERHADGDHQHVLRMWEDAAQRILQHAHRHPSNCLLIDADEARRAPAQLLRRCHEWLGVDLVNGPFDSQRPAGALCLAFGDVATRARPGLAALHAELLASSTPLAEGDVDAAALSTPAVDAAAIAEHYRAQVLAATAGEARLKAAAMAHQALQAELEVQTRQVVSAKQENGRVLKQLHKTQEELEALVLGRDEAIRRAEQLGLANQDFDRQLTALRSRLDQALAERDRQARTVSERSAELESAKAELEQTRAQSRSLADRLTHLQAQLAETQNHRDTASRQVEELQGQLQSSSAERDGLLADRDAARQSAAELEARLVAASQEIRDLGAALAAEQQQLSRAQSAAQADLVAWRAECDNRAQLLDQANLSLADARRAQAELVQRAASHEEERQAEVAELTRVRDQLAAEADQLRQALQGCVGSRDEQAQLARERLDEIEFLARARDDGVARLADHERQLQELGDVRDDLLRQSEQQRASMESLQGRLGELEAALRERDALLVAAHDAHAALSRQADQQHAALESLQRQNGDLEAAVRERDALLVAARDQARRVREQLDTASQVQTRLTTQLAASRQDAGNWRQEHQLLLGQMRRMQDALSQYVADAAEAAAARAAAAQPRVAIGAVTAGALRDTPPHCELAMTLHDVRMDECLIAQIDVRLIEHHGHPGLVIFGGAGSDALSSWLESGSEEGRPYMLLVPVDESARGALQRMGTRDWLLITEMATSIERSLRDADGLHDVQRWRTVASRLRLQLANLPPRLRYDALTIEPEPAVDGQAAAFRVAFVHALFGSRPFARLQVVWRPIPTAGDAHAWPVEMAGRPTEGEDPPITDWALADDGTWAERTPLPLGPALDATTQRARWMALPADDRNLLLAILDALPGAAQRLPDDALPAGQDRTALEAAAARWLREANEALTPAAPPARRRSFLHALLRRTSASR